MLKCLTAEHIRPASEGPQRWQEALVGHGSLVTHLVKVGVAPYFPVGEHAEHDVALLINVCPLAHGPTLKASQAPIEEIGDIDGRQPAAGEPEEGAAHLVINNPQGKLPVIVIDIFCPDILVIVNRQEISSMDLGKHNRAALKDTIQACARLPWRTRQVGSICNGGRNNSDII